MRSVLIFPLFTLAVFAQSDQPFAVSIGLKGGAPLNDPLEQAVT